MKVKLLTLAMTGILPFSLHAQPSNTSPAPETGWHSPKTQVTNLEEIVKGVGMKAELKKLDEQIYDEISGRMVDAYLILLKTTDEKVETQKAPKVKVTVTVESGRNGLYDGPGGSGMLKDKPTGDYSSDFDQIRARVWSPGDGTSWSDAPAGWENKEKSADSTSVEIDLEAIRQNPTSENTLYTAEALSMITHDYSSEQIRKWQEEKINPETTYEGKGDPQANKRGDFLRIDVPRVRIYFPTIDIEEVISDQIPGNEANKLPTAHFIGAPNNPMLMGTISGQNAKLRVKINRLETKSYIGVRRKGTAKILAHSPASATFVYLDFIIPINSYDLYEVISGYDINGNAKLDDNEVWNAFDKTPLAPAIDKNNIKDKVIIADSVAAENSRNTLLNYANAPLNYASNLLCSFAKGSTTVPDAVTISPVMISSTQPGLSHPVGARWSSSNQAATHLFSYRNGSLASNDLYESNALKSIIQDIILNNKGVLIAQAKAGANISHHFNISADIEFSKSEENSVFNFRKPRMQFAFNKVILQGTARIHYEVITKKTKTELLVSGVEFVGGFKDIYDFSFHTKPVKIPLSGITVIDVKIASIVQAGHATIAGATYPDSGKVFFIEVELNTGKSIKWNGVY